MLRLPALGAIAMLAQVVLLRECAVASFGTELVVVFALGVWMLGTAAGAVSGRGRAGDDTFVRWTFVALGALLVLAPAWARGARVALGGVPGGYLPLERQALVLLVGLGPVALLLGLLFRASAASFLDSGGSLAAAYALESLGGIAGGLVATALAAAGAANLAGALLAAALALATALAPPRPVARGPAIAAAVGLALVIAALAATPALDRWTTAWNHPQLLATRDTPYGRVTVTGALGQVVVFEDDALAYESEGTAAEEFVRLAAAQRDSVRSVLVLGGAVEGLVTELLRGNPARIDDVELDRALIGAVAPYQTRPACEALADPRVHVAFGDPRRFLERTTRSYDLVLIGMPEPESGRTNRFYTRECFSRCAARLSARGVLALRLRGEENAWTAQLARRAASVHRALREVFPETVVLPGVTNLMFASRAPLERDPLRLGARLPPGRLVTPAYVRYLYTNDRFGGLAALLAATPAPVNRDTRPVCYQTTMLLWLARFFPRLARLEPSPPGRGTPAAWAFWAVVLAVALAVLLARRGAPPHRAWLVALAGAAGMVLESAVLLAYQTTSGVLYQDLGVLLTAFMAGLALGAFGLGRFLRAGDPPGRVRGAAAGVLVALAALAAGCGALLALGRLGSLAAASASLLACGALVAGTFAVAAHGAREEERARTGPLYAADLLGGCVGSLGAGLFAIPALGLPASALLAALLAAAALPFI